MTPARVRTVLAVLVVVALIALGSYLAPDQGPSNTVQPSSTTSSPATSPRSDSGSETGLRSVELNTLPRQAQQTVALIEAGGPYPYAKDGATFGNRERILPAQRSGYYREYTVPTPGEADRGARRIVTGDDDQQFFYTADHYDSFVRIRR